MSRTNTNAKRPPTAIDAEDKGYGVGSRWYDVLHGRNYTCRAGTKNVAIWTEDYADVTNAASVADAGAVMDSDFSGGDGFMRKTGVGTYETIKSNLVASLAPTANDDSDGGYAVASRWFDITNDKEYVCLDATAGAAVWIETTGTAGVGDMLKATYDPDDDGVIALAQLDVLIAATTGFTMAAAIAMGTYKITGLGDPTLAQDAATKAWVEANTLTNPMTGNLDMGNYVIEDITRMAIHSDTDGLQIRDAADTVTTVVLGTTTYGIVVNYKPVHMGTQKIVSLGDPTSAQDATTKAWVDAHNWAATDITSGTLPVSRGGTGVTDDTYDADKVDGCHAGIATNNVLKLSALFIDMGNVYYGNNTSMAALSAGTDGQVLTTHGSGSAPTWAAAGVGDMLKSTYDPNTDGVIAVAQTEADVTANNAPQAHNQSAATITSGTLPVSRGGTGVTDDTYDADKVDGCHAGTGQGKVYKISSSMAHGDVFYATSAPSMFRLAAGTNGYQLTTHAAGNDPSWAAASDLIFSDTHCPKCGLEFQDGDNLILHVIGHNEVGDILTIPMHQSCAAEPKKTVMIKRKVMEDRYVLDELTGEPKVQRVQKMQEKTVTKHKMKEGYVLDNKSGKAIRVDKDGNRGKIKYNLSDVLETVEETVGEVIYEDVEFTL